MNLYDKKFSEQGITYLFGRKKFETKKILKLLNPQKNEVILEIGCNRGELVEVLRNYSPATTGIDVNIEAIESSKNKGLKIMTAEKLGFENDFFDKIVSSHTIEHIPDLKKAFEEMERALKPGGTAVLIYPFEIVRGLNNFFSAWKMYKNPFAARKLHLHKLNPPKISALTKMTIIKKGLFFAPYPTYYTVLKKKGANNAV